MPVIEGDLLDISEGVIVQQVNCRRVMGAGLAQQIAERYPDVLHQYLETPPKLGSVLIVPVSPTLQVANLYAQYNYGRVKRHTDFEALANSLESLRSLTLEQQIYFPWKIGSGLAGGRTPQERENTWIAVRILVEKYFPAATWVRKTYR